jgi:parallel beta-helix repeat protein
MILLLAGSANAATLTVCKSGCVYSSIQAAVDASSNGDTILVQSGTYNENVNVNKQLTLRGIGMPVVDANRSGSAITLAADGIRLEGFTATGSGSYYGEAGINVNSSSNTLSGNNASNNCDGIYLESSSNNTLISNNANSNNYTGIDLYFSSNNNMLISNNASNNAHGIYLWSSSNNNTLISNNASNNAHGIYLWSSSNNNTLISNNASNNGDGIYLESSSNNTLISNNANSNNDDGINLWSSSNNNTLSGNNASNNFIGIDLSGSNNTLISNNANSNNYGIHLESSSNNTLSGNNANSNKYTGIYLYFSSNNTLISNNANSNKYTGILLYTSSNNMLISNNASNNGNDGIRVGNNGIDLSYSSDNTLNGNNANSNNYTGIDLESSSNNTLNGNNANSNNYDGIHLSYSSNNKIYNNYFSNTKNAFDDGNNIWNINKTFGTNIINGAFSGGNFWSDYAGNDTDGDGLGNTMLPYNSSGRISDGGDFLPLTIVPQFHDILSYYRGLGNDPNVVETTDLLKAADDWSRNITPPGFASPITTQQLLSLADEWAKPSWPIVLSGTLWELQSFGPIGTEEKVLPGTQVTLQFALDGRITGDGGCNHYFSSYKIGADNILSIGSIGITLIYCESTLEQERQYLNALGNASAFNVDQNRLQLFYNDGQGVLNFAVSNDLV